MSAEDPVEGPRGVAWTAGREWGRYVARFGESDDATMAWEVAFAEALGDFEAAIRADERAAWTKAIIGVAEEWSKQDAPDRPADLRALVEEANGER